MQDTDHKIDQILAQIGLLNNKLDALMARRSAPVAVAGHTKDSLLKQRVEIIESVFWHIVNSDWDKKRTAYRVPKALLGSRLEPNIEGVVVSVLLNQASMRKAFRMVGSGDGTKETPLERARRALQESNLVVIPMLKTRLDGTSPVDVAFSPDEAKRVGHSIVTTKLGAPKGWTTERRARSFDGPCGWIDAPEDTSGVRRWDDDAVVDTCEGEEDDADETPVPVKKPTTIIEGFDPVDDADEDEEAEQPVRKSETIVEGFDRPDDSVSEEPSVRESGTVFDAEAFAAAYGADDDDDLLAEERAAAKKRAAVDERKSLKINVSLTPKK